MPGQAESADTEKRSLMATHNPGASKRTRIAVLNSHPIQYFAPLYAYLNTAPDLEVTALYLSDCSIRGGKDAEFGRDVKWDIDYEPGNYGREPDLAQRRNRLQLTRQLPARRQPPQGQALCRR